MFSALIIALKDKINSEIIKYLLSKGANINYAGPNEMYFPLNIAIEYNDYELINVLLNNNVIPDMSFCDNNLNTSLHNILLRNTNNDNNTNNTSNTSNTNESNLSQNNKKIIKMSNLNIQNIDGLTSLHIMAKYNMTDEYINVLKDKDLNFFILDKSEKNVFLTQDISFINLLNKITNSTIKNKLDDSINLTNTCNQNNLTNLEECRTKIKTKDSKNAIKETFSSVILPDVNKKTVTLFTSLYIMLYI